MIDYIYSFFFGGGGGGGCCSVIKSCLTLCDPMDCSTAGFLSFTISLSLLKLMSMHWCCCLTISPSAASSSLCLQSFQHQVFYSELSLGIRRPKYWSFSFSISPSNEYSGVISFRIGWFDLLAVQGTPKSLL